jgi:peptide/nickel transport system permease protein
MTRLIASRVAQGLVVLWVVATIVFVLGRASGSPATLMLPVWASPEEHARLENLLGLDRPIVEQYLIFLRNLVGGDFGVSLQSGLSAFDLYMQHLPKTLVLTFAAMTLATLISVPLGVLAALRPGSLLDTAISALASLGLAMPLFWVAIVLVQVFAVQLGWFPVGGTDGALSIVLPAVSLGIYFIAGLTRLIRSSMLEVLNGDSIAFLRAKGMHEADVIGRHALRNAALGPLTYLGQYTALLLGGAVVIELIFAWPGIGWLTYEAITNRDYPVLQTIVILNAVLIVSVNFFVDVLYGVVDPRVQDAPA